MQRALFDSDIGQHVEALLNKPQEPTKGGWEVLFTVTSLFPLARSEHPWVRSCTAKYSLP
jgi:hypothetical protein